MIVALYNFCLILLFFISLPRFVWDFCVHKKYRSSLQNRFGCNIKEIPAEKKVIWMHGVSMGEVRAMAALFLKMQKEFSDYEFVISTTTETGQTEAKKILSGAAAYFILPFDFSWVVKKVMKKLHPNHLIFCESDFWYNTLFYGKKVGAKTALINGKMSKRSFSRFSCISWFAQKLFSQFDSICVQNEEYRDRFLTLGASKPCVTGNLKLEIPVCRMSSSEKEAFCKKLNIQEGDFVLVIGSTHAPEEEEILKVLAPLFTQYPCCKILLVPRHPERFQEVQTLLAAKKLPYSLFSREEVAVEKLVLIDAMGFLNSCYQVASLAIVAGSYTPRIGGHNVFEPIQQGIPVFFGPYMSTQKDLKELVLKELVGKEVPLHELYKEVISFLSDLKLQKEYRSRCDLVVAKMQNSVQTTFDALFSF